MNNLTKTDLKQTQSFEQPFRCWYFQDASKSRKGEEEGQDWEEGEKGKEGTKARCQLGGGKWWLMKIKLNLNFMFIDLDNVDQEAAEQEKKELIESLIVKTKMEEQEVL